MLEEGHEGDNYNPNYPHHPVAHFDLKPQNSECFCITRIRKHNPHSEANGVVVLISSKDDDHPVMGVFKVSQYGNQLNTLLIQVLVRLLILGSLDLFPQFKQKLGLSMRNGAILETLQLL